MDMAAASNLIERYLRALAQMHDSQVHDARGPLNSLTLNAGLVRETLEHADLADPQVLDKLKACAETVRKAVTQATEAFEAFLTQTDLHSGSPVDLGRILRELGALIAPWLKSRKLDWLLTVPELPVPLEIDRVALWQAMVVAAVEGTETMSPQETFEIRLDRSGRWSLSGPRPGPWLEPLRRTIEAHGGEILTSASSIEVRMPTGARR